MNVIRPKYGEILTLTYYRPADKRSSFRIVSDQYVFHMRARGINVEEVDLEFNSRSSGSSDVTSPLAIVHPLFLFRNWHGLSFTEVLEQLELRHQVIVGMEVADSDQISPRFADWANHSRIAGIALPSSFSSLAFRNSGVTTPLFHVPHGIMTVNPSKRFSFLRMQSRPTVLFFAKHMPYRKGWDILRSIIPEFDSCLFIVKTNRNGESYFKEFENVLIVSEWLPPVDLASLYSSCDLLISPHRGGSFELNCAEALGYGLPVVATRYGCVLDYLNEDNAWLIDISHTTKGDCAKSDHCGLIASPDIGDLCAKVREILRNLEAAKERSRTAMVDAKRDLNWHRATDKLIECVHSVLV